MKYRTALSNAAAVLLAGTIPAWAEVPELLELVPDAKGYELVERFDPRATKNGTFRSDELSGQITRIGYLLKLTGKDGKMQWAFTAMDPFTKNIAEIGLPGAGATGFQQTVTNLEVAGNAAELKTGNLKKAPSKFGAATTCPAFPRNSRGATAANSTLTTPGTATAITGRSKFTTMPTNRR